MKKPDCALSIARITLACAALSLTAGYALGAPGAPSPESIQPLDKNHDGKISLDEFYPTGPAPLHPRMKQVFEALDKDRAGTLSLADTARAIATVSGNQPKFAPDVQGDSGEIPLNVHPGTKRAFVKAEVNGVVGEFLLDTGTTDTILHPDFAQRAGADFVEICMPIVGGNLGKRGEFVSLVRVQDLSIKGMQFRNFHAVLRASTRPTYEFGAAIDGILGANVIFARPVSLNLRQRVLSYVPPNKDFAGVELPLRKGEGTPTVEAEIDGVNVPLLLDSGAAIGDAVLINEPHHMAFRKLASDPQAKEYNAANIRVGEQVMANKVRCLLLPFERSVLGSEFFDQHVITVDIAAAKVAIKRHATQPAIGADTVEIPKERENFHIFLLMGQSNMSGCGDLEPGDEKSVPGVVKIPTIAKGGHTWEAAAHPLHNRLPSDRFGLGLPFAIQYQKSHPGVTVGLIPLAWGGASINDLNKGTPTYADAVAKAKWAAKAGVIKGMLWHQGESDTQTDSAADTYEKNLDTLVRDLRADLDLPNLPFVCGELADFYGTGPDHKAPDRVARIAKVQKILENLPQRVPLTACVSTKNLRSADEHMVHFDRASYIELGKRYAEALLGTVKSPY